jgi:carbonic anhydrase
MNFRAPQGRAPGSETQLGLMELKEKATLTPTPSFVSRLARHTGEEIDWREAPTSRSSSKPALCLAIVTCMDARLDLANKLGISIGDAHILRNAGGRVTSDVVRSLLLSVNLMNVREVGVLHHTNCGLAGTDNDTLARCTGVDGIDFLPFQSLHDSVNVDVTAVLQAGILPIGGIVWGAVYKLGTDQISVVCGPISVTRPPRRGALQRTPNQD